MVEDKVTNQQINLVLKAIHVLTKCEEQIIQLIRQYETLSKSIVNSSFLTTTISPKLITPLDNSCTY